MRVLVVEDEAPAREKLRALLEREDDVELVGEAGDGDAGVEAIRRLTPEVVFLDVSMPRCDGFGVVREIGVESMPLTVFVTAHGEHALEAFEVQALDYLLKPYSAERLARTLERVRARLAERPADLPSRLEALLAAVATAREPLEHLVVPKSANREVLLEMERVDLVRADGNYVELIAGEESYRIRSTLSSLAERLDPRRFLQINRGEIVRLAAVREFQPWFHGDYRVRLRNGVELTWSRRYRARRPDLVRS